MYGRRFFGGRFFGPRYWGDGGEASPTPDVDFVGFGPRGGSAILSRSTGGSASMPHFAGGSAGLPLLRGGTSRKRPPGD